MLTPAAANGPDALERLFAERPMGAMEWGLDRVETLLRALDDPQLTFQSLHVAGTNGKGSTAMIAAAVLGAHGVDVGLYTSPHLRDIRERFVVNGRPVDERVLQAVATRMIDLPETAAATYFEVATALAFAAFREAGVEWAVVETGLGGRLDATNVLVPRVACVTSIGFDHADLLGTSLEAIAAEKAGIFKPGIPAVIGAIPAPARPVLEEAARRVGSPLSCFGEEASVWDVSTSLDGTRFKYRSMTWPEDLELDTSLVGQHQAHNAGLALLSLERAGVGLRGAAVQRAVAEARLPGRFEVTRSPRGLTVHDIAHNREGLDVVLGTLQEVEAPRPWVAVVGILADKPWSGMLGMLRLDTQAIILTQAPSAPEARRWDLEAVAVDEEAGAVDLRVEPDLGRALALARELGEGGTVLVTGSAYTVGDALGARPTN